MKLGEFIFGRRWRLPMLVTPPDNAKWHKIRPKHGPVVSAYLAQDSGELHAKHGDMRFHAGHDYIVSRADGEQSVVNADIFSRTYQRRDDGLYEKRADVVYKYFTLPVPVTVGTREGPQQANPGDWIIEGVDGELWPVTPERAVETYEEI